MMSENIGIVTVTYNSEPLLEDFLVSLQQQEHKSWKCFIIDNNSSDGTVRSLAERHLDPQAYSVIPNKENVGVAAGNNQGIVLALEQGCDWILLINNDTVFPRQLLGHLVHTAAARRWRVLVPKIHYNEPADSIWYGGGGFDFKKGYTGYHAGKDQADTGQCDQERTVDYAPTCCMLIHRSVFKDIGLMDESYFAYFDDTDFCWRLKTAGISIGYTAEVALIHKVGGSTGGTASPFFARMTARNRLYFLKKHFGPTAPLRWLPVFLPYYVIRYLIRDWNPVAFSAAVKGTFAYRAMKEKVPELPQLERGL